LLAKSQLVAARDASEKALPLLVEVHEICAPLRAELALERTQELEKALRSYPASAPSGLTRRELEVLRLVAQGMSNQEIVTSLPAGHTAWFDEDTKWVEFR
jgi:ATP/maltotriose-dependent transcriptional regulator MalT